MKCYRGKETRLGIYLNFSWKITRSYFPEPWMNDDVICQEVRGGGGGTKARNTTKEGRVHDCGFCSGQKGTHQPDVSRNGSGRQSDGEGTGVWCKVTQKTQQGTGREFRNRSGLGVLAGNSFTYKQKSTFLTPFKPNLSSVEQWRA